MRKTLVSVGLAAISLISVTPASAAVDWSFTQDGNIHALSGMQLQNAFETDTGIVGSGYLILGPSSSSSGAALPNSDPLGTNFLSVLGGGNAFIALNPGTTEFAFEWGSIDTYNTLTVYFNNGASSIDIIPGGNFTNPANGNQFDADTNGLFHVRGTAGEVFSGIRLQSSSNSFEIDNLVVKGAVPEPATWAMMIMGLGLVGASMRRRKTAVSFA